MRVKFTPRRSVAAAALSVALLSPVAVAYGVIPAFADGEAPSLVGSTGPGGLKVGHSLSSYEALHQRWVLIRDNPDSQAAQKSYNDWTNRAHSTSDDTWEDYVKFRVRYLGAWVECLKKLPEPTEFHEPALAACRVPVKP